MISALLLAAALGSGAAASFKADFPAASVVESGGGGRFTHASGFAATGLGSTPEAAARAFLEKYGASFGITPREELVARAHPAPGRPGAVRFERRIDRLPLFEGAVVVGVDAANAVILTNATDVPPRVAGRARLSRGAAVRVALAALPGLQGAGTPRAKRGWRASGDSVRPVWRVDVTAARPPGDWRSYVDAESGSVLLRVDLRAAARGGTRD